MASSPLTRHYKRSLSNELQTINSVGAFNRLRRPRSDPHRHISIAGQVLKNRNWKSFDLNQSRFTECQFIEVDFGGLTEVEFADCSFRDCRFNSDQVLLSTPALNGVTFYSCDFERTNFRELNLKDIQFGRCHFLTRPQFAGSYVQGVLRIETSGGWSTFHNLSDIGINLGWDTSFRTDLLVTRPLFVSWATIRTFQQIPFLQVSLFGFVLLTAQVGILGALSSAFQKPELFCRSLLKQVAAQSGPEVIDIFSKVCAAFDAPALLRSMNNAVLLSALLFLTLFFGALMHKIRCPTAITEYSLNDWAIDRKKPILFYEMLSMRNPISLAFTACLYLSALTIFIFGFIAKIIRIFAIEI